MEVTKKGVSCMNEILTAVSTVGFPIVACGAMYVQMNKMAEQHKQENIKLSEAINNNTIALTKLCEKLED